jgi:trimeric autotransporter adhesin
MKKSILLIMIGIVFAFPLKAQAPKAFKYQAVIRNSNGQEIADKRVSLRISILQGSPTGAPVYQETQIDTTNALGLVNLDIGRGAAVIGNLAEVNWSGNSAYLKIETDITGALITSQWVFQN